jgi:hypothetical protein
MISFLPLEETVKLRLFAWNIDVPCAGIVGSNSAEGMEVSLLCLYVVLSCVDRGLCDWLTTHPEESYRVSVCVIKKSQYRGGQGSTWAVVP